MKKKIILFFGIIIQLGILQINVAISLDNKYTFKKNYCVHERHYSKVADSNTWIFDSGKTTKYFVEQFNLIQKSNEGITDESNTAFLNKKAVLNMQEVKPSCLLNSNSELSINFKGNKVNEILIFDVLGNLLLHENNSLIDDYYLLNFSGYSSGIYYIKVITSNEEQFMLNFVKI